MKALLFSTLLMAAVQSHAEIVKSQDVEARVARIVQVIPLVEKGDLQVSITVQDLGGSTDVSPTQTVWLALYVKGEMYSTDATFKIDDVLKLNSAKRISGGIYEVNVLTYDEKGLGNRTIRIDARKAVTEIQAVQCEDFDCAASENFASEVTITKK